MKKLSFGVIAVTSAIVAAGVAAACSDDDSTSSTATPDGGVDVEQPDANQPDTAMPMDAGTDGAAAAVERGKYLVEHVIACPDCHTPKLQNGAPDLSKFMSGVDCLVDADPATDGVGCLSSANLTNDPTGLKNRSDAEIKAMITTGKRPDGKNMASVMPYYALSLLKPADLDAIVAFLRTLPAISHTAKANEPPFDNIPAAAQPIDPTTVPMGGTGTNENGRYLASITCLECHTPELPPGSARPIDMTKPYAGGRPFRLGLPNPPFPDTIYSANITQHASGIEAYSVAEIQGVLKTGRDREDGGVCPPMPAGPMKAFGGLAAQDSADIAAYIKSLPGIDNTVPNGCKAP